MRAILLTAMAATMSCSEQSSSTESGGSARGSNAVDHELNIWIITLDTTRRDFMGFHGRSPSPTPNLDRLARESIVFEDAHTVTPLTLPAHSSLMTGLYPFSHGVRDNSTLSLPEEATTLAEILSEHGYHTEAAVAAMVLNECFGIAQGFDRYSFPDQAPGEVQLHILERSGAEMVEQALAFLETASEPYFYWLHLFDPHFPYAAPRGPPPPAHGASEEEIQRFSRQSYEAEIAYADRQLGRLLRRLRNTEAWDRTVVLFTADHGEGLDDGKESTHGNLLFDETTRVPLLLRHPDLPPRRVRGPVSLVDVAPTLLSLVTEVDPSSFDGKSLAEILHRGEDVGDRSIALEAYSLYFNHGWAPFEAVVNTRFKAIHSRSDQLYDRIADPGEQQDIGAQDPDLLRGLVEEFEGMFERRAASFQPGDRGQDDQITAQLQALGYVTGSGRTLTDRPDFSSLPDPQPRLGLIRRLEQALSALQENRQDDAIAILEELCRGAPESAYFHETLGTYLVLYRPEQLDQAERHLLEAVRLHPERPKAFFNLGLLATRRARSARQRAEELHRDGEDPEAEVRQYTAHREQAESFYRSCLALESNHAMSLANLASVLEQEADVARQSGNAQETASLLAEVIELYQRFLDAVPADHKDRSRIEQRLERCRRQTSR